MSLSSRGIRLKGGLNLGPDITFWKLYSSRMDSKQELSASKLCLSLKVQNIPKSNCSNLIQIGICIHQQNCHSRARGVATKSFQEGRYPLCSTIVIVSLNVLVTYDLQVAFAVNGSFPLFIDYLIRAGRNKDCGRIMQKCDFDPHWKPYYAR